MMMMMMIASVKSVGIYYIYMAPYLRRLHFNLQSTSNITSSFRKISAKQQNGPSLDEFMDLYQTVRVTGWSLRL